MQASATMAVSERVRVRDACNHFMAHFAASNTFSLPFLCCIFFSASLVEKRKFILRHSNKTPLASTMTRPMSSSHDEDVMCDDDDDDDGNENACASERMSEQRQERVETKGG